MDGGENTVLKDLEYRKPDVIRKDVQNTGFEISQENNKDKYNFCAFDHWLKFYGTKLNSNSNER